YVDEDAGACQSGCGTEGRPPTRHGRRHADVEAVDLADGSRADGKAEGLAADGPGQLLPAGGGEGLAVSDAAHGAAVGRKNDGRSHHWTSQGTAADFIDTDQQVRLRPGRPLA